ncbi:helix-turn-helix domain-containing protein [Azospirillum argentinense]
MLPVIEDVASLALRREVLRLHVGRVMIPVAGRQDHPGLPHPAGIDHVRPNRFLAAGVPPGVQLRIEPAAVRKHPQQATLKAIILAGPDPKRHGCVEWTLPILCEVIAERFAKTLHPASLSRIVRRLNLSKQKTRPRHPQSDAKAQAAFQKRGCAKR